MQEVKNQLRELKKRQKESATEAVSGGVKTVSYAENVKGMRGHAVQTRKTVIVKAVKEKDKTVDEVKTALKKTFTPGKGGLKISGVRKGRNGVILTLADDDSWQTVV